MAGVTSAVTNNADAAAAAPAPAAAGAVDLDNGARLYREACQAATVRRAAAVKAAERRSRAH
jgi:hypothetical protein